MAINIFQGGKPSGKSKSKVNAASASARAAQAKSALASPSVTSDSGGTAVGKTGTLSKVGNFIGKAAGIASKFLPGIGGTIAKGISNIFNDPEWWQSVPGEAVTLNVPLRRIDFGYNSSKFRFAIAEFSSLFASNTKGSDVVMVPTDMQVTQYLMPEIRKVVNAIPLQPASVYGDVLAVNATLYAIWRQLKKVDFMLKHGQTYIANMNDSAFPLFQVANAAWLQTTINRLEEYLRANVRLPHTLCEYLAWRFGRVYKSNANAKAGLILYNVHSITAAVDAYQTHINALMALVSSDPAHQQANADMYNAYYDHDLLVEIKEDTQYKYDPKEFCLRTNADIWYTPDDFGDRDSDVVFIDSALDNPTTFMASTVSTNGLDENGKSVCLFPIQALTAYIPSDSKWGGSRTYFGPISAAPAQSDFFSGLQKVHEDSNWRYQPVTPVYFYPGLAPGDITVPMIMKSVAYAAVCKALDIYNKDVNVTYLTDLSQPAEIRNLDLTALSMDMAQVPYLTIANEHVYAFANLVDIRRKHSMSYKEAETLVSRDVANLVEHLDVATAK